MELKTEHPFEIRFSEVDLMKVVWHGSYPIYLEDAREAFGREYGLSYQNYIDNKVFAPIVDMHIQYRKPLLYGMHPVIRITYRPTDAAKVVFDYEIFDPEDGAVYLTARTVQVFMDMDYQLMWGNPQFYMDWKKKYFG